MRNSETNQRERLLPPPIMDENEARKVMETASIGLLEETFGDLLALKEQGVKYESIDEIVDALAKNNGFPERAK